MNTSRVTGIEAGCDDSPGPFQPCKVAAHAGSDKLILVPELKGLG
ncbi:MAG: hypothetical protein ACE5OP_11940 [Candidatus Glassbacteria bacterium]